MTLLVYSIFISNIFNFSSFQHTPDSLLTNNYVYSGKIRSVQLYKEGWNLSYPIIKLKSGEKLILNFDLLSEQAESYSYTFIHCDKDWKQTDIFINDYLEGYTDNPVENYQSSFNTTVSYYHYNFSFPNDRVQLKISGNYIVKVYPSDKPEEPVITQRFIVTEDVLKFDVSAHRPLMTRENNNRQQIDFTVNYNSQNIIDPARNIYATILQNGRWDNARKNLKPDFFSNYELKYNSLSEKNIFPGGNEFRYFDIKSIKYLTEFVRRIDFASPNYNVFLTPSESRENKPYYYWQDFNGKFYIAYSEGQKPEVDADYVNVFFTLPSPEEIPGGKMFVSGSFNNWLYNNNNLMRYNNEKRQYEATIMLKQGWYNYEYAFLKDGTTDGSPSFFEGSHYETDNDYIILVYYHNPRERYDRVIGSLTLNTLNKLSS
jgi:hypothetical protein